MYRLLRVKILHLNPKIIFSNLVFKREIVETSLFIVISLRSGNRRPPLKVLRYNVSRGRGENFMDHFHIIYINLGN